MKINSLVQRHLESFQVFSVPVIRTELTTLMALLSYIPGPSMLTTGSKLNSKLICLKKLLMSKTLIKMAILYVVSKFNLQVVEIEQILGLRTGKRSSVSSQLKT